MPHRIGIDVQEELPLFLENAASMFEIEVEKGGGLCKVM